MLLALLTGAKRLSGTWTIYCIANVKKGLDDKVVSTCVRCYIKE